MASSLVADPSSEPAALKAMERGEVTTAGAGAGGSEMGEATGRDAVGVDSAERRANAKHHFMLLPRLAGLFGGLQPKKIPALRKEVLEELWSQTRAEVLQFSDTKTVTL